MVVTLAGVFATVAVCEALFPRRKLPGDVGWRWLNNVGLSVITISVVSLAQLALAVATAWWVEKLDFGLLQLWQLHWLWAFLIAALVLEFADFLLHLAMHKVPWLWRVHAIHHSDTDFDLTLAYRNHPLAAIFLLMMRLPVIVLLGAPVSVVIVYESMRVAHDLFSHSNIRIPEQIERRLRCLIVTPDYHRLHHSSDRRFTDSNFSSTFSVFDYLFGTVSNKPYAEHESLEVGLEYFRSPRDTRLDRLLLMPFRRFGR